MTPRERRDHFQRVFLKDSEQMLVLDELLRMLHYWSEVDGDELVLRNFAVRLMGLMGLHRPETTLDVIREMKAKTLEIQAMEPLEEKE